LPQAPGPLEKGAKTQGKKGVKPPLFWGVKTTENPIGVSGKTTQPKLTRELKGPTLKTGAKPKEKVKTKIQNPPNL